MHTPTPAHCAPLLLCSFAFPSASSSLDTETNDLVAIKVINLEEASEDIDEIRSEITMLSECKSSYVTKYITSFTHGSELCIVMEYLGGGSVHDLLDKGGLDENLVAVVTRELLKAIDYLHSAGKIHRDIKAANILLSSKGEVKISDCTCSDRDTHREVPCKSLVLGHEFTLLVLFFVCFPYSVCSRCNGQADQHDPKTEHILSGSLHPHPPA